MSVHTPIARPITQQMDRIRVAAVQTIVPEGRDPLQFTIRLVERAAREKIDLMVLPEYHLGHTTTDSSDIASLAAACANYGVNVVVGAWLDNADGPSTNSALVFSRCGKMLGHYDKMHAAVGRDPHSWPPGGHEAEWRMKTGEHCPTFDMDFGRLGVMTCYDGYFPEVPHCLSLGGAEVIAWINGRYGSIEDFLVRSYCFTSFVHLVTANQSTGAGTQIGHYPFHIMSISTEANREFFLTAQLDLAALREHRVNARMFHQRRPDLYGALVQKHEVWKNYPNMVQPPTIEELRAKEAEGQLAFVDETMLL